MVADAIISANADTIYKKTNSLEVNRYFILLIQIIKKRLESGCLTSIDFKNRTLKVRGKKLTEEQVLALEWLNENPDYIQVKLELWLSRRKK